MVNQRQVTRVKPYYEVYLLNQVGVCHDDSWLRHVAYGIAKCSKNPSRTSKFYLRWSTLNSKVSEAGNKNLARKNLHSLNMTVNIPLVHCLCQPKVVAYRYDSECAGELVIIDHNATPEALTR